MLKKDDIEEHFDEEEDNLAQNFQIKMKMNNTAIGPKNCLPHINVSFHPYWFKFWFRMKIKLNLQNFLN